MIGNSPRSCNSFSVSTKMLEGCGWSSADVEVLSENSGNPVNFIWQRVCLLIFVNVKNLHLNKNVHQNILRVTKNQCF